MLASQQLMSQQPQNIVVESQANKCWESKAKFKNNMLQLLLIGGEVVLLPPASFNKPRIPTYTQATKNILAMQLVTRFRHRHFHLHFFSLLMTYLSYMVYFALPYQANPTALAVWFTHQSMIV
jgi:hypothetical protein